MKTGSFWSGTLAGADCSDQPVMVRTFRRIFEEKTGALLGGGGGGGRPVRLQRGRSNDISTKKFFADGSP